MDTEAFPWPELLPELQNLIRERLGPLSARMLQLTCRREHKHGFGLGAQFDRAASEGYLSICSWIYEETQRWEPRPLLHYSGALLKGHVHVAEWAHGLRLSLSFDVVEVRRRLLRSGPLESLQWLHRHGFYMPAQIHSEAEDVPTIQWLVNDLGRFPTWEAIDYAFFQLPWSAERLLLFLTLPRVKEQIEISVRGLISACLYGVWREVDFAREHFTSVYEQALREHPFLASMIADRPTVPQGGVPDIRNYEAYRRTVSSSRRWMKDQ